LAREGGPPAWLCLEAAAIEDVDFSGGQTLLDLHRQMADAGVRVVVAEVDDDVRAELDRYGFTEAVGADAYFASISEVVAAFGGPDAGSVARSEDATA
jgi:MFS superfamily sulfate permease-like transporter